MICEECGKECNSLKSLHLHISKMHFSLQDYYSIFFPRFDLFSKEPIKFKTYDDYFDRDFNSKENFALWCSREPKLEVQDYIISCLEKRCEKKQTEYLPSHLELKTLFLPSWFGLSSIFGSVDNAVDKLKRHFKFKYEYSSQPSFSKQVPEILIDTREQNPLPFEKSKKVKLTCGDYCVSNLYSDVFVERKSLMDLFSTISTGKERFIREIKKAKDLGYYLVVVTEDSFEKAFNLSPQNSFSKSANGKYLMHNIREIVNDFDNIQFVFSNSRKESIRLIKKIFQMQEQVKMYDLEFLKDFKII